MISNRRPAGTEEKIGKGHRSTPFVVPLRLKVAG